MNIVDQAYALLDGLLKYLTRKKSSVTFNDLSCATPVSPLFGLDRGTPVDRYYIEKFLLKNSRTIRGRVLEVGNSDYTRNFGGERVVSCEVLHAVAGNGSATMVGDLAAPETLPEGAFDCFICTQTLNVIFEVRQAAAGAHRLLKPGGVLLCTVSGINKISRYDMERWGDYWRFTDAALQRLFAPLFGEELEIESFGNVLAATALLQGLAVEDLPDPSLLEAHDPDYQVILTLVARKAS